ncbi:hypothetical protein MIMGU_mgv1a018363mg [Erythranthe guttata]|uniref:Phospholipase D n=1 Tax=Erythranthe guttata TaxID=4155 RepID=A0A022PVV6_ERYGU|nr:hypothetical protein MIMGU_mgv1a018363mg [Erythranthe guttata]
MENNETIYLHGDMDLVIVEARRITSTEFVYEDFRRLRHPYVKVYLGEARVAQTTRVRADSQNPMWNEHFELPLAHPVDQEIGAFVPAKRIAIGDLIDEWFPVVGSNGTYTAIRLQITFTPCDINPSYTSGISEDYSVKRSYFPMRHGGKLTLYQDAHVIDGRLPEIGLDYGRKFEQNKCWEDICHTIWEAHNLIYVIGWSIYHKVRLAREDSKQLPNGGDLNLGELLKYKSQQGVRVVLLIWDDKTSHDNCFIKTGGLMKTHDKETRNFFKHSPITCVLDARYRINNVCRIFYSQHQKCVITDTKGHENNRKITAFLGGLDLCDGRYDTPDHQLYDDLNTLFKDDYHNPIFRQRENGPRQPWHDLHCKIEGPAAYDVLKNFEQRWKKATECSEFTRFCKKILGRDDYNLVDIEQISQISSPSGTIPNDHPSLWASKEDDLENWHIQIFRSVDSESVVGFPRNVLAAKEQAIRCAQRFIFIENQYFIGSSFGWTSKRKAGANNLIPMELALKIVSKIRTKERFSVYVVIPMWPEGEPDSDSVRAILYWQGQTIQMMYQIISQELKSANFENAHPSDYLNFYCLGNREERHREESSSDSTSEKYDRFMIYVHSKGMVVDDEYVIIGSANINQRSMAGHRDTKIAMGAYQPHYTCTRKKEHPCGQIYGYRMSLWAEHLGCIENCFKYHENLECVRYINNVAEDNWKRYTADEYNQLQGHILKYPIEIGVDGSVNPLPGHELFPDVGGLVLGNPPIFPPVITALSIERNEIGK